ncbi:putative bifunctional diguanylate cyclase/phosphodiesterase [Paenibacillus sp. WLX2291]|uniref:putative bifunctional diguanylate cyclase/phosphodiesterase n=1 Tax=Paenibacillus sp. WLX2291 TaxID=3296934 RepID=UPI0039844587
MYVFVIAFFISFVPFVALGLLALKILWRHPDHALHRLTMLLISAIALIFLSDFLTQVLDHHIARQITIRGTYIFSFGAMALLIYFFTKLSRVTLPGFVLHTAAAIPLCGIVLMECIPSVFSITVAQGRYWRVEVQSIGFQYLVIVISCYTMIYLLLIMWFGYRKLKSKRIYQHEQRMMLTIIRGSFYAVVWLLTSFVISEWLRDNPYVPIDSLPTYAGLILAYTLQLSMSKHQFLIGEVQRYKLLFTLSTHGIALINSRGIAIEMNPAFRTIMGVAADRNDVSVLQLYPEEQREDIINMQKKGYSERRMPQGIQLPVINFLGDSLTIEVNSDFLEIEGELYCYAMIRDITKEQKDQQRLLELAYTDSLTGLANRYQFSLYIEQMLKQCRADGTHLAVMQMDVDHFKWINDTMGHSAGDQLLVHIAGLIRRHIPETSLVARMGGDEFALLSVLTSDQLQQEATEIANRILSGFHREVNLKEKYYDVSCSIGIYISENERDTPEMLLSHADIAMYHAKKLGRNQYQIFNEQLKNSAERLMQLQRGLEAALKYNEFSLVYQPQVDIRTDRTVGVEALLRWNSATLGTVSPQEFIPIAEQNGLIRPIGEWVMKEAARQAAAWERDGTGKLKMSVNVSASQLNDPQFIVKMRHVLEQTTLPPQLFCLEFTESVAIRESEHIHTICENVITMGSSLSVDDFGTGYSSLRTVTSIPFECIKIDRSLVFDIDRNPRNEAVVRSVLELAEQLNMSVLAEGVETVRQVELLKQLGCHYVQGYYYARPMSADELRQWLISG